MDEQKEIDQDTAPKTRVRITTLKNRSDRAAAIRLALIKRENKDFLTEEVTDRIYEEGCRKMEEELGLTTTA